MNLSTLVLIPYSITALIGMVRYKSLTMPFKLLSIYLIYTLFESIANKFYIAIHHQNILMEHIETIASYIFFSLIYYYLFKNKNIKRTILISIPLYIILFFVNSIFLQPFNHQKNPSTPMMINDLLFVIFALMLFKQMLQYPLQVNITKQSIFWFNTAILIYSASMFFNSALINYYPKHANLTTILTYFWYGFEVTLNLLLTVAVLMDKKETAITNAQ
jgi:hypothetical protein